MIGLDAQFAVLTDQVEDETVVDVVGRVGIVIVLNESDISITFPLLMPVLQYPAKILNLFIPSIVQCGVGNNRLRQGQKPVNLRKSMEYVYCKIHTVQLYFFCEDISS